MVGREMDKDTEKMDKKKKVEPMERLEKEFRDFQKEWKEFRSNEFGHLTKNVSILIGRSLALEQSIPAIERSIQAIEDNIIEILKRMK